MSMYQGKSKIFVMREDMNKCHLKLQCFIFGRELENLWLPDIIQLQTQLSYP